MRPHWQSVQLAIVATLVAILAGSAQAQPAKPDPAVQKTFEKLLTAIEANDREAFVADATDAVEQSITPQVMESLNQQVGHRLKQGYQATYLCVLKQHGYECHLWKLSFKDEGDDLVVRLVLEDNKVAGFFLQ